MLLNTMLALDSNNKYRRNTVHKVRKLILILAFTASVLPIHAQALGLGDITVNSALNQKLNARLAMHEEPDRE
ncbi:MAG: hypothetical protein PF589_06670 [Gammaproteobacteria bacterium]|jgi:Tfp pilus assembly protein FimV|nr:hypothetical protein [Gammaproteobacteria bacterium]